MAFAFPLRHTTRIVPASNVLTTVLPIAQRRTLFDFFRRKKRPEADPEIQEFVNPSKKAQFAPRTNSGNLAPGNIFDDPSSGIVKPKDSKDAKRSDDNPPGYEHDPSRQAAVLDPDPVARRRWQRKMVIRTIRKRGRINKTTMLARTERVHAARSPLLETSVKKLMPLARQVAGKSVEDALVQLRFSKKKVARQVAEHLIYTRDQATVAKGMGPGRFRSAQQGASRGQNGATPPEEELVELVAPNGRKRLVNPSSIYIDQAWVNRGQKAIGRQFRARGQVYRVEAPHTSISFQLKEETTRLRLAREREEKRRSAKPWVPHPDRAVPGQRQFPLW